MYKCEPQRSCAGYGPVSRAQSAIGGFLGAALLPVVEKKNPALTFGARSGNVGSDTLVWNSNGVERAHRLREARSWHPS